MTKPDAPRMRHDILGEASRWFVELDENPQDEATRRAFDGWLRRSPEHVHAFLQISAHWEESTPRRSTTVESVDQLIALAKSESNVVGFAHHDRAEQPAPKENPGHERTPAAGAKNAATVSPAPQRIRGRRLALAACVLLSVTGALVWQQFFHGVYSTRIGEQRSLTLADGSTVELNSRTRIRVKYTSQERHIDLLEGQALFHVARNKSLPFIVQSRNTQVRAVGTQFDVYRKETGTVVTVVEGRVAVVPALRAESESGTASAGKAIDGGESVELSSGQQNIAGSGDKGTHGANPHQPGVFLDAGQQLTLGLGTARPADPARLEPSGIEAVTAWTQRRLIFKGAPLSEVVSEFNRYSERPLVVTDAEIAAIPISGVFSSSDPTDLLRFLREVAAYNVRETPTVIEISRK